MHSWNVFCNCPYIVNSTILNKWCFSLALLGQILRWMMWQRSEWCSRRWLLLQLWMLGFWRLLLWFWNCMWRHNWQEQKWVQFFYNNVFLLVDLLWTALLFKWNIWKERLMISHSILDVPVFWLVYTMVTWIIWDFWKYQT